MAPSTPPSSPPPRPAPGPRYVATCQVDPTSHASAHERATHEAIARRLADLTGREHVTAPDPGAFPGGSVYWVPNDTIVGAETAHALGIRGPGDLFGGVVPHGFVATKAITHPLVGAGASAPAGWSHAFGRRVRGETLAGFSTFTVEDAREAGRRLLAEGPVRVKPVSGTGGRGQRVVRDAGELEDALAALDDPAGTVLEQDLAHAVTFSVGRIEAAGLVAAYLGTQRETRDNAGQEGYGGSTLLVARGGFDALASLAGSDDERAALDRARAYDEAAPDCYPGLFASRRNYDVVVGLDARGRRRCGVLEQSWRVGGASPAEVAALAALCADPSLKAVRAGCVERFGPGAVAPPGADVLFHGVDPEVGPLLKYAWTDADLDLR